MVSENRKELQSIIELLLLWLRRMHHADFLSFIQLLECWCMRCALGFFSIFCSHSPNKEIASMVHCKSLVIPIGYHTCLLCHCLFSICCTNKINETAAFKRTQYPILFASPALNVEHFTSCIFVHSMSYLDPGTNLTWTTTKPNAPKLSGGWLQMAVCVLWK